MLESFGWKGREAEWVTLVCLHSGVFTRAQFRYFCDIGENRIQASRFVRQLIERKMGAEVPLPQGLPNKRGGTKACRISNKEIYRKLGIENVRHRREADDAVMLRRLLSLDYVLERLELPWLPTEQEKVAFFESLGIDRKRIPKRVYQGAVGTQTRYFALKLPIACNTKNATFAYVDPGKDTDTELRSWGAAHEWLWQALNGHGIKVTAVVIGADHSVTTRAEAALITWQSRSGKKSNVSADGPWRNDPKVKAEIKLIEDALTNGDSQIIAQYGGVGAISKKFIALKDLPQSSGTFGPTIDDYATWISDRLRVQDPEVFRNPSK